MQPVALNHSSSSGIWRYVGRYRVQAPGPRLGRAFGWCSPRDMTSCLSKRSTPWSNTIPTTSTRWPRNRAELTHRCFSSFIPLWYVFPKIKLPYVFDIERRSAMLTILAKYTNHVGILGPVRCVIACSSSIYQIAALTVSIRLLGCQIQSSDSRPDFGCDAGDGALPCLRARE